MFDNLLKSLVQQEGQSAVVQNSAVPNEHNEAVMQEATHSITSGLQEMAHNDPQQLQALMNSDANDPHNPAVNNMANHFAGNITNKFGIPSGAAKGLAMMLIPIVLGKLFGKAKDPNDKSISMTDILGGLTGGGGLGGMLGKMTGGSSQGNQKSGGGGFGLDDLGKMFGR